MQEIAFASQLDEIHAFVMVAQQGSFSAAARLLGKDGSVITRRINALEAQLGVRLIERTTRRLALTEAGQAYLTRVQALLDELHLANSEAASRAVKPQGSLRISAPLMFGRLKIAPILPEFMLRYPRIDIDARFTDRNVNLVEEGFDVAIRLGLLNDSSLVARRLAEFRRHLYAAPAYLAQHPPLAMPQQLLQHQRLRFVAQDRPAEWDFECAGEHVRVSPPVRFMSDDMSALICAAVAGMGIIESAPWLVTAELAAGTLVPVLAQWQVSKGSSVYLVMPSASFVPTKTRVFADWLAGHLLQQ